MVRAKPLYYPTTTPETFEQQDRLSLLIENGKLFVDLHLPMLDPVQDHVMICGSPSMLRDLVGMVRARGFVEGTSNRPGSYVIERAFVEK